MWLGEHGLLLHVILPVGISFYTFQALSYSIDVYKGKLPATHDPIAFFAFISFFPQLVAGPIERATNMLPQFFQRKKFDYAAAVKGSKLILWGFFMKLCIADRVAEYVNAVYNHIPEHNGSSILIATVFFAFQIYCDFGGYSLIAIGVAKTMGFSLMENFRRPYFSTSLKEFWRRWHISLSTWFMDYVYIPLGGNRVPYGRHLLNLFITFLVSGIWHGANWTFILWGATHGIFLIAENIRHHYFPDTIFKSNWFKIPKLLFCFLLICFAWIFFRANTLADAFEVLHKIFFSHGMPDLHPMLFLFGGISIVILFVKEALEEWHPIGIKNGAVNFVFYLLLTLYILIFGVLSGGNQFIYFQF